MKKSMVTAMLGGVVLLLPKYAFSTSEIVSINNQSTIERVVLYHNNSAGSGWYRNW